MPAFGRPREPDQLRKDFKELEWSPSDRACAIIGVALVEEWLETAIANRLLPDTKLLGNFFGPNGGLDTFSSKCTLGFLLGIYGDECLKTLNALGTIRNRFAHRGFVRDFSHLDLQTLISSLKLYERLHAIYKSEDGYDDLVKKWLPTQEKPPGRPTQREKFTWTVKLITAYFFADAISIEEGDFNPLF